MLNLDKESKNEYLLKNTYMEAYGQKELTTKKLSLNAKTYLKPYNLINYIKIKLFCKTRFQCINAEIL